MRILFMQKIKGLAGSENYLIHILPELLKRGIEAEFLAIYHSEFTKPVSLVTDKLRGLGVKVHDLVTESDLSPKLFRRIHEIYQAGAYDMLSAHLVHADFWAAMVKLRHNRKMVIVSTKHGYDEVFMNKHGFDTKARFRNKYYWTAWFAERFVNRSFAISDGLRKLLVANGICKKDKLDLIYYGVDMDYHGSKDDPSKRFSKRQIGIVGRLIPLKGHRYVIGLMPRLLKKYPDLKLVIIGSGSEKEQLLSQAAELGVSNAVVLTGFRKDIMELTANSDMMIVPSMAEGFGFVFLEAFACRTPVVAFDVPAGNELIEDGVSGSLVKPFDTEQLFEKICFQLDHPEVAKQMAEAAYKRLKAFFAIDRMVDETEVFLEKVYQEHSVPRPKEGET